MVSLYRQSVEIILAGQHTSGAYIASPNFPTYHYCWFRDGSFSAHAMDLAGEQTSARGFHTWAAGVVNQRAGVIQCALQKAASGQPLTDVDLLHTRYTLEGDENRGASEWPNFQLDGFGTWLWALEQHARRSAEPLPDDLLHAAGLVAAYLCSLWKRPCYDCWEEFPEAVHPHTLAAIFGGLSAHSRLSGQDHGETLQAISACLQTEAVAFGHFVKFLGSYTVDASLLGLAVPYAVVAPDHPTMLETVRRIETSLRRDGGGVHRYPTDTYYGGGEWVLLAGWLGWYYAEVGKPQQAAALLEWIERRAGPDGSLPEQAPAALNDSNWYEPWVERWGPIAHPLLWSHAKYIILRHALKRA